MDKKYEDLESEIEELLNKYRAKWQLNSLNWIDYDDVCQIIRMHIYKKWHLWDQTRPFKPWASILIGNQIKNLIRNHYSNFAKPCLKCPHYLGGEECSWTNSGEHDATCGEFKKWQNKKEDAYNLKIPASLEVSSPANDSYHNEEPNYEIKIDKIHNLVLEQLSEKHQQIYRMLYIEHIEEKKVAQTFGFKKDTSKRKTPRYKQINNLKKKFYLIAAKIIKEEDLL